MFRFCPRIGRRLHELARLPIPDLREKFASGLIKPELQRSQVEFWLAQALPKTPRAETEPTTIEGGWNRYEILLAAWGAASKDDQRRFLKYIGARLIKRGPSRCWQRNGPTRFAGPKVK
jgi:hypothetical protein